MAKRLGVSRSSVYALCAGNELRHVRVMNCIRVAQSDSHGLLEIAPFRLSNSAWRPTASGPSNGCKMPSWPRQTEDGE